MTDLNGKIAFITGGASGIGAATSMLLAESGATVIISDVQRELGEGLVTKLGPPHQYVQLDVSDSDAWEQVAKDIPKLDILILNAGIMTRPRSVDPVDDPLNWIRPSDYYRSVTVNFGGVVFGINACLPLLKPDSTIVVISSIGGIIPYSNDPLYTSAKYALVGLVGALAPSLAPRDIRIIGVCPVSVDTPIWYDEWAAVRRSQGSLASAEFMAESILKIHQNAKSGEIWIGGGQEEPRQHQTAAIRTFQAGQMVEQ